ncbi:F-box only protein 28-like [Homarus americanus]|uniref:F-box only protein 28-like 1 n=1 Tax=Homarus americanus TaxID=6706 RepID=A0A8J5MT39_HOMAM|nr:F-box only protein 28-like [Homarus americanus]KAG7163235.1 F-box only protein 28-like 1 [Homarus americanus]
MKSRMVGKGSYLNFLDLPEIVVEKTLSYLAYEELSHLRIVCKRFNQMNQMLLNKGFRRVERYQAKCLKEVKSQLPRRESERRNHPLSRHCDILTAIETRLSLLNMTFNKYIDCHMCCFIPGKVIDEIYRVLRFIQSNKTLPRTTEILTELRDISSMAMEHFEEKIIGPLKLTPLTPSSPRFSLSTPYSSFSPLSSSPTSSTAGSSLNKSLATPSSSTEDSPHLFASYKNTISTLKKEVSDMKSKFNEMRRKVSEQERVALEQNRILSEQTVKLTSQEGKLTEVNRKLLEQEQRFSEVLADMARMKEDSNGGSSSSSSSSSSNSNNNNNKTDGNWPREEKNQQFYGSPNIAAPTIGSTVFVAANMMQPNLLPVNLTPGQLSSPAYLTPPMQGYSSGGIALGMSPGHAASSTTSYSTCVMSQSSSLGTSPGRQISFPQSPSSVHDPSSSTTQGEDSSPSTSQNVCEVAASSGKSHGKKYKKRKLSEEEGFQDTPQAKWTKM